MRQKNNSSNNLVTKEFFKRGLKSEFGTFEKRLDKKFSTKKDLSTLEIRIDLKFDKFARKIDDNAQKYRDQILTSNDKLVKELQEMREENIIGTHQTVELRNRVETHEKRIGKLEHNQQVT